ncbi:MAG: hypothetical protein P8X75_02065 [Limibacillus sp.]
MQLFAFPHIVETEAPGQRSEIGREEKAKGSARYASQFGAKLWGQGGFMGAQERVSTFFRKPSPDDGVQPGSRFRFCGQKITETAEVIALIKDEMGIPHVRFRVTIQAPYQRPFVDGPRTLNLKSFRERYCEAVVA